MNLTGNMVAVVTPFRNDAVDIAALAQHVDRLLAGGVDGLVPCGTTGESATLSHDEHDAVIEQVIARVARRVPVIAGTGSNSTAEAVRLSRAAQEAGADALLSVTPYYNRPTQSGLRRHFLTIADAVDIPVILYDIPGRTGVMLEVDTIAALAEHPNIQAIKEATGQVERVSAIRGACGLQVLAGDDALALPVLALGGVGLISVLANVLPAQVSRLVHSALEGDFAAARQLHDQLFPAMKAMFVETNPVPVKAAMAAAGWIADEVRLPLAPLSADSRSRLLAALARVGFAAR
jgi:4-hydroxy-tetrahydrodipicolinate synthase